MILDGRAWRTSWLDGAEVVFLDQIALPFTVREHRCATVEATARAIETMVVRGAGAIGGAAAHGLAQAALQAPDEGFFEALAAADARLRRTRPTAYDLFHALDTVHGAARVCATPTQAREAAVDAALAYVDRSAAACRALGEHGAELVADGARVSTHCNAGWLAFVDWGSALAPVYAAHRAGRRVHVWVDETRPRQQGARLTAFELAGEGVPHTVIPDGALAHLMGLGRVDLVITGTDRVAANGDVANKIGTRMAAIAAAFHGVPFFVAAPTNTLDPDCPHGGAIPIETRADEEVTSVSGPVEAGAADSFARVRVVNPGSAVFNPAFDVTPADLIAGLITEVGVVPASPEGVALALRLAGRATG